MAAIICWERSLRILESAPIVGRPLALIAVSMGLFALGLGFVIGSAVLRSARAHRVLDVFIFVAAISIILVEVQFWYIDRRFVGNTTDGAMLADAATDVMLAGQNPYNPDNLFAFEAERYRPAYLTHQINGDYISGFAYPPLGLLLNVPFTLIGLNANHVYTFFFLLMFTLFFWLFPPILKPLTLTFLLMDTRHLLYSVSGISDVVWAFGVCVAVVLWRRRLWSALVFGLACAFKQQAWFFLPFLGVYLLQESREQGRTWRQAFIDATIYMSVLGAVFVAVNLPFILTDWQGWLSGMSLIFEPMVYFGQGLVYLDFGTHVFIPKQFYSLFSYGILAGGFALYAFYAHRIKLLMWILPAIALWFNYRSLSSYWYFNLFPLMTAYLMTHRENMALSYSVLPLQEEKAQSRRWLWAGVGIPSVLLLIVLMVLGAALRPSALQVEVIYPIISDGSPLKQLTVRVSNLGDDVLTPRFSVLSQNFLPAFWNIESGAPTLAPNESAIYRLSQPNADWWIVPQFPYAVLVGDAQNYDLRGIARVAGDLSVLQYDNILNGDYRYWHPTLNAPTNWGFFSAPNNPTARVQWVNLQSAEFSHAVSLSFDPQPDDSLQIAALDTWIAVPDVDLQLWVNPPAGTNDLNAWGRFYGLELRPTPSEKVLWVLFGTTDRVRVGDINAQVRYVLLPAPMGTWSLQTLNLRDLYARADIRLPLPYNIETRFNNFIVPTQMMNFRLILATQQGDLPPQSAVFGPVINTALRPNPRDIVLKRLVDPIPNQLHRAYYNLGVGNAIGARQHFEAILERDNNVPQAHFGLGRLAFLDADWQTALAAFAQAEANGHAQAALIKGYSAWAYYQLGQLDQALLLMPEALNALEVESYLYSTWNRTELHTYAGWVYLAAQNQLSALNAFQLAVAYQPSYGEANWGLGTVQLGLGDTFSAEVHLLRGAQLGVNFGAAHIQQLAPPSALCTALPSVGARVPEATCTPPQQDS